MVVLPQRVRIARGNDLPSWSCSVALSGIGHLFVLATDGTAPSFGCWRGRFRLRHPCWRSPATLCSPECQTLEAQDRLTKLDVLLPQFTYDFLYIQWKSLRQLKMPLDRMLFPVKIASHIRLCPIKPRVRRYRLTFLYVFQLSSPPFRYRTYRKRTRRFRCSLTDSGTRGHARSSGRSADKWSPYAKMA
jgi:hypothetical protein